MQYWPDCPVPGCPNKICLALGSDKCFPHTPGNRHVNGMKIDAHNCNDDLLSDEPEPAPARTASPHVLGTTP